MFNPLICGTLRQQKNGADATSPPCKIGALRTMRRLRESLYIANVISNVRLPLPPCQDGISPSPASVASGVASGASGASDDSAAVPASPGPSAWQAVAATD